MDRVQKLRSIFVDEVGVKNVYFQPPSTVKMEFPCIVYEISAPDDEHADNQIYIDRLRWKVTLITRSPKPKEFTRLRYVQSCVFDRHYTADNLHHYAFEIYM